MDFDKKQKVLDKHQAKEEMMSMLASKRQELQSVKK
jgi:hypothetical protein